MISFEEWRRTWQGQCADCDEDIDESTGDREEELKPRYTCKDRVACASRKAEYK